MDRRKERNEYEEYLYQKELSERTVQIYLIQVERFWNFLGERLISKKETVAYKNYMQEKGWKVTTINLYIVAVNSYLVYTGHTDCILKTERVQRRQCPDDVLSNREYHQLLEYTRQRGDEKYLPPKLIRDLERYCQKNNIDSGPVFLGNCGKAINRVSVYKMLVKLVTRAGVPKAPFIVVFRNGSLATEWKWYLNMIAMLQR